MTAGNGHGPPSTEELLIGVLLRRPDLLDAHPELESDDFERLRARIPFDVMRNLAHDGKAITPAVIVGELERDGKRDALSDGLSWDGSLRYLEGLFERAPADPEPAAVADVVRSVRAARAKRDTEREAVDGAIRSEIEVDELALREAAAEDDGRSASFARALSEVKVKLDATTGRTRPWLFGTDATELLGRTFEGARWLVTSLITRGGITMIGAEPKAAKTWLATEIAIAVATGTRVCGEFSVERVGRAAYFYAEDLDVQVRNRVRALLVGSSRQLDAGRLYLQPRGMFLDVLRDEDLAWIVASVRKLGGLDMLVLDPLRDIHSGEEDKSDSMRDVMRRLRVLSDLLDGCSIAVVHHAPKSNKDTSKRRPGQNLRGSGAIHGAVDCGLYLTDSDGDGVSSFTNTIVSQVKGARSAGRFSLSLKVDDDMTGEAIDARWAVSYEESKQPAVPTALDTTIRDEVDQAAVVAFVRENPGLSRTGLRDLRSRPIPDHRFRKALDRALEAGQLEIKSGKCVARDQGSLNV